MYYNCLYSKTKSSVIDLNYVKYLGAGQKIGMGVGDNHVKCITFAVIMTRCVMLIDNI